MWRKPFFKRTTEREMVFENAIPIEVWGWPHHDDSGLHEERALCGNIEAICEDISHEVKAWTSMGIPTGQ